MGRSSVFVCWFLAGLAVAATGPAATPFPSFKQGAKWQFEIQDLVDVTSSLQPNADVWDIDLWVAYKSWKASQADSTKKSVADLLHAQKKTVICYFNFGAIQPEDCDFPQWVNHTGGSLWNGPWYGDVSGNERYCEKYVDLKVADVRTMLQSRVDTAIMAGCDGVDPDNIDLFNVANLKISQAEVVQVLRDFTTYAHSKKTLLNNPLLVGQKNAQELVGDLFDLFDFAVLESCVTEGFCSEFQPYIDAGKPVIDIEYPDSLFKDGAASGCNVNGVSSADFTKYCQDSAKKPRVPANFSEVLKLNHDEFGLNACTQYCGDSKATISATKDDGNGDDPVARCDFKTVLWECKPACDATLKTNKCCSSSQCSKSKIRGMTRTF